MENIKEEIRIREIKSHVSKRIQKYDSKISNFMFSLGSLLEFKINYKIGNGNFFIIREIIDVPGEYGTEPENLYKYSVYWCYQLNPNKPLEKTKICSEDIMQEEFILFKYVDTEKIENNSSDGTDSKLSIILGGPKLQNEYEKHIVINYNNKNYDNTSIFNKQNLLICAEKIVALVETRKSLNL